MSGEYAFIADLAREVEVPSQGTLSRTVYSDNRLKAVLFAFDAGQELSEHTATMPAIIHVVKGEAHLTLGEDHVEANAGTWVHMAPNLKHSVAAKTPLVMLLLLLKPGI
ncbi:MAG: cupin domain-containing protein [Candidatus Hydrogenedentes bacterium]|nr:cupin domain-containing protein [Candidatus Hydrogenedentota bacterium]